MRMQQNTFSDIGNLKKNCDIFNDFKIELFTIKKKLYKYKYNKLKKGIKNGS